MKQYLDILNRILTEGTEKSDRTGTGTISIFGTQSRYNLDDGFPLLTTKKLHLKSIIYELLWFLKGDTNVKYLQEHGVRIWNEWADENGSIGTAYGYVVGEKFKFKGEMIDQMDYVLKQLKETPYSRRIMTNLYQFHDLATGHLDPCCYSATYNVTKDKNSDKLVLNMVLNQRSQDILAANNWNVCQYAILLMMVAQVNGMIPGQLVHVIADAHIYDRHVDAIKELLSRPELPAPKVSLNPAVKNFYDFTTDDLIVEGYEAGEQIRNIPIAV